MAPSVRLYRGVFAIGIVALTLLVFLSFFFVFVTAPLAALGGFYLGFLALREIRARRSRSAAPLLEYEAAERRAVLARAAREPGGVEE